MEPSKSDWRLYREKVSGWQENYMERLIKDYITYLSSDERASTKFWEMEKRIKADKKTPGVCIELNKRNMIFDLVRFLQDGVIIFDDLDEFSGVTFRWHPERLEAVADGTTVPLYDGMPIWSVYFYDLTGDGNPELCSTISFGSGIIDDRIIIYDYAGGASYELSDRGNFDYVLNMQEDSLIVEKRAYMQDELIESGELVFLNDTIQIKTE